MPTAPPLQFAAARRLLHRGAGWAGLALALLVVGLAGLHVRKWAWDQTEPMRYVLDIDNAFRQGTRSLATGFVDRYDDEAARKPEWVMELDYGPGRLAVATLWARWVRARVAAPAIGPDPATDQWRVEFYPYARRIGFTYALCRPLLLFNLAGEGLAAVAVFALVRRYAGPRPARANVLAAVAASLFWLDPALITNAHCWPQWDSWVLPFLLWGWLLASLDLWFCAGVAIAAGAMFKGQILFGVPVFLLWPLFQGRVGAAARWTAGLASGVAAATAVWLVRVPGGMVGHSYQPGHTSRAAVAWVVCMAVAAGLVALAVRLRPGVAWRRFRPDRKEPDRRVWVAVRLGLVVAALLLVAVPLRHADLSRPWADMAIAVAALAALAWVVPLRSLGHVAAAWVATALLLCWPAFGGSGQWFLTGIAHGTTARDKMSLGDDNNLANLLDTVWGWKLQDPVPDSLPSGRVGRQTADFLRSIDKHVDLPRDPHGLPLKYVLLAAWVVLTVACSAGAAMHDRRRSARFLVAVSAPWVVMFAVLGQMHQRYLLWGATTTSMSAAVSPGLVLLHVLLSVVSAGQELVTMMGSKYTTNPLWRLFHGWTPGMGWAVLLTALIYVYVAVTPGRRSRPGASGPHLGPAEERPEQAGQHDRRWQTGQPDGEPRPRQARADGAAAEPHPLPEDLETRLLHSKGDRGRLQPEDPPSPNRPPVGREPPGDAQAQEGPHP